jgi:hypothetical protein
MIGCTNAAATKWKAWPKYHHWYTLGYFDWDGGSTYRSGFGFDQITTDSHWNFKWQPAGFPIVKQHRRLACNSRAQSHGVLHALQHNDLMMTFLLIWSAFVRSAR